MYKFKAYNIMAWFTYIMKWLPQKIQLTSIISYRYKNKLKTEKKFPCDEHLYFKSEVCFYFKN